MKSREWFEGGVLAAVAACVVASGPPALGDAAAPAFEYVRDKSDPASVVRWALSRSKDRDAVLFVFDAATFEPPPGRSEFNEQHRFAEDLPSWISALRDISPAPPRGAFVAATTSERVTAIGPGKWESSFGADLHSARWDDKSFREFEPAQRYVSRLLAQVPGVRKSLVLVTGDVFPEKTIRTPPFHPTVSAVPSAEPWRRKLREFGTYWNPESVGDAVASAGARLLVVAPEARFGDFLPLEEIPQAPWASRPHAPSDPAGGDGVGSTPDDDAPPGTGPRR